MPLKEELEEQQRDLSQAECSSVNVRAAALIAHGLTAIAQAIVYKGGQDANEPRTCTSQSFPP